MNAKVSEPKTVWTPAMIETMTNRYPHEPSLTLAKEFGIKTSRVYQKAARMGLKKTPEFLSGPNSGRTDGQRGGKNRFKPGHQTWNKGINFNPGGRSAETRFKKGMKPHTWQPIGTERFSKDGYLQRKVADTGEKLKDWVYVHIFLWQEHHKKDLPKGHAIVFKDGDKTNIVIENLECLSRAELMKRNSVHNLPKELAELVQLRGALNRRINHAEKKGARNV